MQNDARCVDNSAIVRSDDCLDPVLGVGYDSLTNRAFIRLGHFLGSKEFSNFADCFADCVGNDLSAGAESKDCG